MVDRYLKQAEELKYIKWDKKEKKIKLLRNDIFIIDPEFKKVLFRCEVEEYNEFQEAIKQLLEQIQENQ